MFDSSRRLLTQKDGAYRRQKRKQTKTSCERNGPIRKTSGSAYGPLTNPPASLSKISYKYNSMLTYIPVSFLFSFIFRVRVRVINRVRVRVSFRVRVMVRVRDR